MMVFMSLLDKFHCFSIHGEGRLCLLGALLQSITAFNKRDHGIQVVNCLLKTVQLFQREEEQKEMTVNVRVCALYLLSLSKTVTRDITII